jgi:tRNA dimethylallyltransferase
MATPGDLDKLVAIVGPTAAGKSAVAMQIAQERNGEIVCADSRTVYIGMDIGTNKPSKEDQALVPHHLLDVAKPNHKFSVADFQKQASAVIADIQARGKLAILVGGTGLYVDAVLYNYSLRPSNTEARKDFEKLKVAQLQELITEQGLPMPENAQNPRHLIRTLETGGEQPKREPLRPNTLVLGFMPASEDLKARIIAQVDRMFEQGLEQEVKGLSKKYSWQAEAMKGIGYREWRSYFEGKQTLEKTKELIVKDTWQYARRQRTWFKRNPDIHWDSPVEQPSVTIEG